MAEGIGAHLISKPELVCDMVQVHALAVDFQSPSKSVCIKT